MKLESTLSTGQLEDLLLSNGYQKVSDGVFKYGHLWSLHPDLVPHKVTLKDVSDEGQTQLDVQVTNRAVLKFRDNRLIDLKFSKIDDGELLNVSHMKDYSSASCHAQAFFSLLSVFGALFACIFVLWMGITFLLESEIRSELPKVRTLEAIEIQYGLVPYPDTAWYQDGISLKARNGALNLAFLFSFIIGLLPIVGLWLSETFKVYSKAFPVSVLISVLLLSFAQMMMGGSLSDLAVWSLATVATMLGYVFVVSFRRPYVAQDEPRVMPMIFSQATTVLVSLTVVLLVLHFSLPKKSDEMIPRFGSEAKLIIRDELLKRNEYTKKVSDFYYNNVFVSAMFLRAPLSKAKRVDNTVLYLGKNFALSLYAIRDNMNMAARNTLDECLNDLKNGLYPPDYSQLKPGRHSFDLFIADGDRIPEDFWKQISTHVPEMKYRTYILRDETVEMHPDIQHLYDKVYNDIKDAKMRPSPGLPEALNKRLQAGTTAVQLAVDNKRVRAKLNEAGNDLMIPWTFLLLMWLANGWLSVVCGFQQGGGRRLLSVALIVITVWFLAGSFAGVKDDFHTRSKWNHHRTVLVSLNDDIKNLLSNRAMNMSETIRQHEHISGVINNYWNEKFFADLDSAVNSDNEVIKATALASLQRLLSAIREFGRLSAVSQKPLNLKRGDKSWDSFQEHTLPILLKNENETVAYWAIKCVPFVSLGSENLRKVYVSALASRLVDPSINVRDQAALSLGAKAAVDTLTPLYVRHVKLPGLNNQLETCDYVRHHIYQSLRVNKDKLPEVLKNLGIKVDLGQ